MKHGPMVYENAGNEKELKKYFDTVRKRLKEKGVVWLSIRPAANMEYGFIIIALMKERGSRAKYVVAVRDLSKCVTVGENIMPSILNCQHHIGGGNVIEPYTAALMCEIFRRIFKNGYAPFYDFDLGRPV